MRSVHLSSTSAYFLRKAGMSRSKDSAPWYRLSRCVGWSFKLLVKRQKFQLRAFATTKSRKAFSLAAFFISSG